jgi:sarcosine oxidase subunit gamma
MAELHPVGFLAQVNVRADEPAARALGLPREPNTVAADGERTTLWLGPDEWLVTGPAGDAAAIERQLAERAAGTGWLTTVDLSANRTAIDVSGPGARDLLAAGCALDLHPRAFGPGRCAQTLLARSQAILEVRDEDTIRVHVRASFATYLTTWLIDALAALAEPLAAPTAAG